LFDGPGISCTWFARPHADSTVTQNGRFHVPLAIEAQTEAPHVEAGQQQILSTATG